MATYWDTSALIKLYAEESDTFGYEMLYLEQADAPVISVLHLIEMYYTLHAKEVRGDLLTGGAERLYTGFIQEIRDGLYLLIDWQDDIPDNAHQTLQAAIAQSPPMLIRSLDGFHLGALRSQGITRLITADIRMRQAAQVVGITCPVP